MLEINNTIKYKNCPLCGSSAIYSRGKIIYNSPVKFSTYFIKLNKIPEIWQCKTCLSFFAQNIVPENQAKNLYINSNSNRWMISDFQKEKTSGLIKLLDSIIKKDMKALDIGCNSGSLLDYVHEHKADTFGIEISKSCSSAAKKKGHKIFKDYKELPAGVKFDIIFAFDLVEHLYNINLFFDETGKLLNKDGKLIILTGNPYCLSAKIAKNRWWYFTYPEHITFPSLQYFKSLKSFQLERYSAAYNSQEHYKSSLCYFNKKFFNKLIVFGFKLLSFTYNGRPSVDKDHGLVILNKNG